MTTDTSKAPERIHLGTRPTRYNYGFCYIDADLPLTTEYVRADIHAAMQARAETAEAERDTAWSDAIEAAIDRIDGSWTWDDADFMAEVYDDLRRNLKKGDTP